MTYTCNNCPSGIKCSGWGACSVTCGEGIEINKDLGGLCQSTRSCTNKPCPGTTFRTSTVTTVPTTFRTSTVTTVPTTFRTSTVTTVPTTFRTSTVTTVPTTFRTSNVTTVPTTFRTSTVTTVPTTFRTSTVTTVPTTFRTSTVTTGSTTFRTSNVTTVPTSTANSFESSTFTTETTTNGENSTQVNDAIIGGTEVSRDSLLAMKVAVPVQAAVAIIAVILIIFLLRRKRRNDTSQSDKALDSHENVPERGKQPYSADNVAFTPDYDMAFEDRAYNYVQSQSSDKGLSDYTYADSTTNHKASAGNIGGSKSEAASSDPEYDYTCGSQLTLIGHGQAVYNHLDHGQLMNNTNVSRSTYDTNQFQIIQQCKSDPSDYDHMGRGVAKITDNNGDGKSYDHLPNPEQALSNVNSQTLDPTYNQLGPVGSNAAFKHRDSDQSYDHLPK